MKRIVDFDKLAEREAELLRELDDIKFLKQSATKYGEDFHAENPKADTSTVPVTPNGSRSEKAPEFGQVDSAVRTAISEIENDKMFSSVDVRKLLLEKGDTFNASSISTVMSKLKEAKQIEVVQESAGRRPALYKKSLKFTYTPY